MCGRRRQTTLHLGNGVRNVPERFPKPLRMLNPWRRNAAGNAYQLHITIQKLIFYGSVSTDISGKRPTEQPHEGLGVEIVLADYPNVFAGFLLSSCSASPSQRYVLFGYATAAVF